MTDVKRALFREGRLQPPDGFYKVLESNVPASTTVSEGRVILRPTLSPKKVSFESKFELRSDVIAALRHLVAQTQAFPLSPNVDVFERIVTPGATEIMIDQLLDEAHVNDTSMREFSKGVLEEQVIPTHEVQGHISPNLNPDKCFWEPTLIWSFLINCLKAPSRVAFQDNCDRWEDELLTHVCIVTEAHELYAMLKDEEVWEFLRDETRDKELSNVKRIVRTKQDSTAASLLNFLIKRSGGDLRSVNRVIEKMYLEGNSSLSFSLPHMLRDLNHGFEIDDIPDKIWQDTQKKFAGQFSPAELEAGVQENREAQEMLARNPVTRGLFSTYVSVKTGESTLSLEVYSAENSVSAINSIPFIVSLQEARRILQSEGRDVVVSPVYSMEKILRKWLRLLAAGKEYNELETFDVMKDLGRFYDLWKPAVIEARRRIFRASRRRDF